MSTVHKQQFIVADKMQTYRVANSKELDVLSEGKIFAKPFLRQKNNCFL